MRSLEVFQAESPGVDLPDFLESGGARALTCRILPAFLADQTKLAVEPRDSLKSLVRFPSSPSLREAPYRTVSLTPLIGMGLVPDGLRFNLMPDLARMRKDLVTRARGMTALGVAIMTVLVGVFVYGTLRSRFREYEWQALRRDVAQLQPDALRVRQKNEVVNLITKRQDDRVSVVSVLAAIHPLVLADMDFQVADRTI